MARERGHRGSSCNDVSAWTDDLSQGRLSTTQSKNTKMARLKLWHMTIGKTFSVSRAQPLCIFIVITNEGSQEGTHFREDWFDTHSGSISGFGTSLHRCSCHGDVQWSNVFCRS